VSTNLRLVVVPSFGLVSPRGVGTVAAVGQRRGDTAEMFLGTAWGLLS